MAEQPCSSGEAVEFESHRVHYRLTEIVSLSPFNLALA